MKLKKHFTICLLALTAWTASTTATANTGQLWIGGATVEITPEGPVALAGQRRLRIGKKIESPISATALVLETRAADKGEILDQVVFVSCDLVAIRKGVPEMLRAALKGKLPDLDPQKIVLNATHTHTAPVTAEQQYTIPKEGVIQPEEYTRFLIERLADAVTQAHASRAPGRVAWGLGHAVVAMSRLPVYHDGSSKMYGPTKRDDFQRFEGFDDHGLEVLFFWDREDNLIATAVNIACPSQQVGGSTFISADFWHPTRELLRQRHGEDLLIVPWTGASGGQGPTLNYRKAAEQRMRKLRGVSDMEDIAARIAAGWEEALEGAAKEKHDRVTLAHHVETVRLPVRRVTGAEAEVARKRVAELGDNPAKRWDIRWNQKVVDRFENQQPGDTHPMELHVVRIGDVAVATNAFELYTDYAVQMKERSPALQTFVVQLSGPGTYLPTARAVAGGAYGAVTQSNTVGPKGGRVLVDRTVEIIEELWKLPK